MAGNRRIVLFIILLGLLSAGCAPNRLYRSDYKLCQSSRPEQACVANAVQEYDGSGVQGGDYLLSFVEFDDQGQLHDRAQLQRVLDELNGRAARDNLLIVVFVHGWKHNADRDDENIASFRKSLEQLSRLESIASRQEGRPARKVAGVFLGWRGMSLKVPLVNNLSFWERKNTAHKVGQGAVAEVLARLEEIRDVKATIDETRPPSRTRLVIIGHSFGGAVVYSALSQILMERFVQTKGPVGMTSDVRGFGDLVVLINPAFEAMRFLGLSDMANERRTYFEDQLPVMAVLTSEADWATKYAFWGGRFFSTLFENERNVKRVNGATRKEQAIKQGSANRTAIGHFEPIQTHYLEYGDFKDQADDGASVKAVQKGWDEDRPGQAIVFPGSTLKHLDNSVSRNPYLLIKVDKKIIPDHNDIYDRRVTDFLKHVILLSTQDTTAQQRVRSRQAGE